MSATVLFFFFSFLSALLSIASFYIYLKKRRMIKDKLKEFRMAEQETKRKLHRSFNNWFIETPTGKKLASDLGRANVAIEPSYYMLLLTVIAFSSFVLLEMVLNLGFFIDLIIAIILIRTGSVRFLQYKEKKIIESVNQALPEVCRLLASAVKAGLNIQQGMELVASELKEPTGSIFLRLNRELKLGTGLEQAIIYMTEKVKSKELSLMANAITVQHRAGGNLGKILEEMAKTLEMRERVSQEIKSSTAESKFIALVLPFMPVMAAIILNLIIPGFLKPLLTLPGMILAVIFISMLLIGFTVIKKVTDIKV